MQPDGDDAIVMTDDKPKRAFISYSHKDKRWRDELLVHLAPLEYYDQLQFWTDQEIKAGENWLEQIIKNRDLSTVAILLITPNFLASPFIRENELGPFLENATEGGIRLIWIPVETSSYKQTELCKFQAAIDPSRPISEHQNNDRNRAWIKVVEAISEAMR